MSSSVETPVMPANTADTKIQELQYTSVITENIQKIKDLYKDPKKKKTSLDYVHYMGYIKITTQTILITILVTVMLLFFILMIVGFTSGFKSDPYGGGIRYFQSRDDTGALDTTLNERKYVKPMVSNLTSTPESPNFSEYYGIDVNLKDGAVMIERENFENKAISVNELERANKGM